MKFAFDWDASTNEMKTAISVELLRDLVRITFLIP